MHLSRMLLVAIFFVSVITNGCKTPTSAGQSSVKAIVTPDQFARAIAVIEETRSYIPYAEPGTCEARATWLAALFAAESIPTTKRYVFAPSPRETLRGPGGIPWEYHVAIMIRANDSQEHMIADPTWGDDWLKVDWRWRELMTDNPSAYQLDVPGSIDGTEIRRTYRNRTSIIVESLEEMPKFKVETFEKACGTMSQFQSTVSGLDYAQAQRKLKAEMLRIIDVLEPRGVLDWGALTPGVVYCGREKLR